MYELISVAWAKCCAAQEKMLCFCWASRCSAQPTFARQQGLTAIEVMVSLVIIATVSAIAIPSCQFLLGKHRSSVVKQQLIRAIRYARSQAVSYQQRVTLEGNPSWTAGYRVSIAGKVLKQFPSHIQQGQLRWRGFPDVDQLKFTPQGFTYHQNGTFLFYRQDKLQWRLVVNKAGRVRPTS